MESKRAPGQQMLEGQREMLTAFKARHVKDLVFGGHAVGIHAEPCGTKDLDIFIKADEENGRAVFNALAEFGAQIAGVTPDDFRDKPTSVFQMGVPPGRIDVLQGIAGVGFDEAWEDRVEEVQGGYVPAHVISRKHLIQNKLRVGRSKDLADMEKIREAAEFDDEIPPPATSKDT